MGKHNISLNDAPFNIMGVPIKYDTMFMCSGITFFPWWEYPDNEIPHRIHLQLLPIENPNCIIAEFISDRDGNVIYKYDYKKGKYSILPHEYQRKLPKSPVLIYMLLLQLVIDRIQNKQKTDPLTSDEERVLHDAILELDRLEPYRLLARAANKNADN